MGGYFVIEKCGTSDSGRGKAREIAEYARPREPVGAVILGTGVPGGDTNHSSGMLAPILPKLKRRWTTQT